MDSQAYPKSFNLAIVGGGIAGLTLAISLLKHNIPITIYESHAQFGEIGAGVGFEPHMVHIMELIDPRIKEAFLRHANNVVTDPPKWFDVRVGDKTQADENGVVTKQNGKDIKLGETLFVMPAKRGPRGGIHRAHFLDELVKLIPSNIARFGKRLIDVTEATDGSGDTVLHFSDGTTAQHSAVLGCDGIKSRTREIVLGKEEARPVFSGKYAYRGLIPMAESVQMLGEAARTPQMYCGYKGHLLTFPIANGKIMNVVAFSSRDEWHPADWVVKTSREDMIADYADWTDSVQNIVASMQNPDIWALFNHTPARTFFQSSPRICLVGDAAHASTPHQGAGAGMCIEDCYILGELLAEANTVQDVDKAFKAYDEVRRPRALKLVETSREAGTFWEFETPEKDDLGAFERRAVERMKWIWDHDMTSDLERARATFRG
ncbi:salicylate 1-hydroxylase-like protein [Dothidotthia symphoricarpi CBS 119687]|uniref:Salicylate 1-hydroxylase-like protein n=1 Tax=Dothidotthia symphoricarpi CBS 119687 TaxID=1392245 RepID=A0A6A6AMM0_9PLEO|nr:salicylate 1-hydroxylase-like protein [Dothidotthia symphoricarpi CBS 119687]KAF2131731.1 salicylate 1-hydroxylase-like protein [Dothidotthia symphoricarpi CBS 119687]